MKDKGIFFLANDKVYELAIAFLNSFRDKNPEIDLCLIPYDDNFAKIESLSIEYNFSIYSDSEILRECDRISTHFHSSSLGAYRKLAAWHGDFKKFAYIDIDTIVLENIDFVFDCLDHAPIFTSHSNIPSILQWVWKSSIFDSQQLTKDQIQFAANTGFFVSIHKLLTIDYALSKLQPAMEIKEHMELHCMEQPFLNYLIVTSNYNYSSLLKMAYEKVYENLSFECWAGLEGGIVDGGKFHIPKAPNFFLIHWAGLWQKDINAIPYKDLWLHYRNLRNIH
jgi:hypothetical protein